MIFQRMIPVLVVFLLCEPSVSQANKRVIYGDDDRRDLYEVEDLGWLEKARSTVALVSSKKVAKLKDGTFKLTTAIYGEYRKLCTTEPFYHQERAAHCSGSLVAEDIILTAGHCIRTKKECDETTFVFDFAYKQKDGKPGAQAFDNVYKCKQLIKSEYSARGSDFALIQLDRKVIGRTPLDLRIVDKVEDSDELVVIGHPSGLPTKIADGGKVRGNYKSAYFTTNLDTYGGNSGSAVFNSETGLIEGVLVRGARDFVKKNGCYVSNVCAENGCQGEDVTRASEVLPYLETI